MSDDRLLATLRDGDAPQAPDPAFAERMFDELCADLRFRGRSRTRRSERLVRTALLAATVVLVVMGVAATLVIGGLLRSSPVPPAMSNGWIVFSADGRLGSSLEVSDLDPAGWYPGDLYIVRDGVDPRRIIGSGEDGLAQSCPAFSPDGRWLAYVESRWQWDPTGGRLAAETRRLEAWRLMVTSIDDAGEPAGPGRAILEGSGGDAGDVPCATWAPDSRRLALSRWSGPLDLVSLDGRRSILDGGSALDLAWSPDGSSLAVLDDRGVRLVPVGSRTPRQLVTPDAGALDAITWVPDGSAIVASGVRDATPYSGRVGFLASIPVDGTEATMIVQTGGSEAHAPAFAPHGSHLAYLRLGTADPQGGIDTVVVTTLDDVSETVLRAPPPLDGALGGVGLAWAPDGSSVLYVGYRFDGEATLVEHPLDPAFAPRSLTPVIRGLVGTTFDWQAVEATPVSTGHR